MLKRNSIFNLILPFFLGLIVIVLYVATATEWYSGDDMQWTLAVQSAVTKRIPLHPAATDVIINPSTSPQQTVPQIRYFLELPTLVRISRAMSSSDDVIRPIQMTHAILGGVGVVFFYLALALFLPRVWSLIISLGLASSYAWWYYSTHLEGALKVCR
jgi:hypothetical protein